MSYILLYTWYTCLYILYFYLYWLSVLNFNFYYISVCVVDEIQVKIARGVLPQGLIIKRGLHGNSMCWVYSDLEGFYFLCVRFLLSPICFCFYEKRCSILKKI